MPSAKILEEKKQLVSELATAFKSAQTLVVADYRGLTVAEDTELRAEMRKQGVTYKVVKNTMATLAAKEAGIEGLESVFMGPTAIAYSDTDPVAPAKVLKDFSKKFKALEIKGGATEGAAVDLSTIERLASIPSKETLLTQLVFTLNAPITGLARALNEIAKKNGGEGATEEAPAQEEPAAEEAAAPAEEAPAAEAPAAE